MKQLSKNLLKNGIASVFAVFTRVGEQLFLVPFFVSTWGVAQYGEWLTLTAIPAILSFSDFGFGSAIENSFVLAVTGNDYRKAAAFARTGLLLLGGWICAGCLVVAGISSGMGYFGVFDGMQFARNDIVLAISCVMGAKLFDFLICYTAGIYRASHRAALGINIQTVYAILRITGTVAVLMAGKSILALGIMLLGLSVVFNTANIVFGTRFLPFRLRDYKGHLNRREIGQLFVKGMGYLSAPVSQSIYNQGSTLAVRLVLGAEAVALFNTIKTLIRSCNQFFAIQKRTIFPEMQYELGCRHFDRVRILFTLSFLLAGFFAVCSCIFFSFFGQAIYAWWLRGTITLPMNVFFVFLIGLLFNSMWWPASDIFAAANRPEKLGIVYVTVSCGYVCAVYFGAIQWGMLGVAVSSVLFELVMVIWVLPNAVPLFQCTLSSWFGHIPGDVQRGYRELMALFAHYWAKRRSRNFPPEPEPDRDGLR